MEQPIVAMCTVLLMAADSISAFYRYSLALELVLCDSHKKKLAAMKQLIVVVLPVLIKAVDSYQHT